MYGRLHVIRITPPSDEAVEQENDHITEEPAERWTKGYLKDALGYRVLTESTVVIDDRTGRVLFACVMGPDINEAGREHERLNSLLNKSYEAFRLRNSTSNLRLVMHGMRHSTIPNRDKQFGFYRRLKNKFNSVPENQRATTAAVARVTSAMSSIERRVSPLVHARRVDIARETGASGRCSAVAPELLTLDQCPAFAMGCSVGYISHPHTDDSAYNVPETVLFARPRSMPREAGWCFASVSSRVVVDLQANPATFVMVPARELHGTPYIMTPNKDHEGIGVVITNKGNLLRRDAAFREKVKEMWKEAENGHRPEEGGPGPETSSKTKKKKNKNPGPRPETTTKKKTNRGTTATSTTDLLSIRMQKRADKLRSRLRCSWPSGAIPRRLLDGWTLSPSPPGGSGRRDIANYKYSHPEVGTFGSLTGAKEATLSLFRP